VIAKLRGSFDPPRLEPRGYFFAVLRVAIVGLLLAASGAHAQTPPQLPLQPVIAFLPTTLDWRAADLNLETALRQLEAARAAAGLNISGGSRYDYSSREVGGVTTDGGNLLLSVNASLTLLPWSPTFDAVRVAARNLERAILDRADVRNTIVLNAIALYYSTRVAITDLELARRNEGFALAQLKVAEAQLKNGQINRDAFLSVQRASENARVNTLSAKNALEITKIGFFNAINQAPRDDVVLVDAPLELPLPQGGVDALIAGALARRSDVLKAKSRVGDAEDALTNAQRDRLLPAASLNLGVGQFAGQTQTGAALNTGLNFQTGTVTGSASVPVVYPQLAPNQPIGTTITVSAQITVPVVAPGADARIASAQSSLNSAQAGLETARRAADLDVRQRFNDALIAGERLGVTRLGLQNAKLALETAQTRFTAGLNTSLDVQSAEIAVRQAERDLENAVSLQMNAAYRLQNAIGTFSLTPKP
jgi:outer membrane protein